ncbi:MAG: hypothetical protein JWP85_2139 [Rhodoglobus sp.]|nr:hypothetical protein [Rhodoglobus sp.]
MLTGFDLRLRRYVAAGDRADVLATQDLEITLPIDDPSTVRCSVSTAVYGELPDIVEAAVEFWNGSAWVEFLGGRMLLKGDDDDARDVAGIHSLVGIELWSWLMRKAIVEDPPDLDDLVDGHRPFNSATPGAIVKTVIDEEQALGWAPYLSYDFTATHDSDGVPWASELTIAYQPGTTLLTIVSNLLAQGVVEKVTEGRTLHLYNPEHGVDLSTGGAPVRVGHESDTMPVKRSIDDLITDVALFGEGDFRLAVNNPSAVATLGRLVAAIQQGGVSDPGTGTLLAQAELDKGESIREQVTATEFAAVAAALPGIDYQVGDKVQAWFRGEWAPLRVAELVLAKDQSGVVAVSPVLNDRFLDLLAKLAKRTIGIVGGALAGGTGAMPSSEDRRRPKAPVGLVVASEGYWSEGVPLSQVAAEWSPVTQGENDVAIDITLYELWGRPDDGATEANVITASDTAFAAWSPFEPGTDWLLKVRAQSKDGVWGEFSAEEPVTMAQPDFELEAPTPPLLLTSNGAVQDIWDGLFDTDPPSAPPANFRQIDVEYDPSEDGEYSIVGTLFTAEARLNLTLQTGSTWWFRHVAVDRLGRRSAPSTPTMVVVEGIDGGDILVDSLEGNRVKVGTLTVDRLEPNIGELIVLDGNVRIIGLGSDIDGVATDLTDTNAALAEQRQHYDWDAVEMRISQPGSDKTLALDNDSIQFRDGLSVVMELTNGIATIPRVVVDELIIGDAFKVEAGVTGVVWRHV